MKKRKIKIGRIIIFLVILLIIALAVFVGLYKINTSAVKKGVGNIEFVIKEGDTYYSISNDLYEKGLIKSEEFYKFYVKFNKPTSLVLGKYEFNDSMSLNSLIRALENGNMIKNETITITFPEGKNIRGIAKIIEKNTNNTYDDVMALMKDVEYIDSLIEKYWFLTDKIKNEDIYYPLEGYLFPDTYEFYASVDIKGIFEKMLNNMESKLEEYKEIIDKSKYSVHEMITLASIVELEGASARDRSKIAGVFTNRLKDGWTLGSCVTTYYAEKIDDWSILLKNSQLNKCNPYNTRGSCVKGLPVGPVANPGTVSLKSTFNPDKHDDYYFVSDCNGKVYSNKTESGHVNTINELRRKGLWCDS